MAYAVSLQTHDIGIRLALGAEPRDILRMVLNQDLALIVVGIGIGAAVSFGLTRFLASQLWGVSASDPWTFAAAAVAILSAGLPHASSPRGGRRKWIRSQRYVTNEAWCAKHRRRAGFAE